MKIERTSVDMASAAEQQQQTTLEFYQAMADFKNMFPQMDDDVIEVFFLKYINLYFFFLFFLYSFHVNPVYIIIDIHPRR